MATVVDETFSREFMSMIRTSLFVPFLHPETPRPLKVPMTYEKLFDRNCFLPNIPLVKQFLATRDYIIKA